MESSAFQMIAGNRKSSHSHDNCLVDDKRLPKLHCASRWQIESLRMPQNNASCFYFSPLLQTKWHLPHILHVTVTCRKSVIKSVTSHLCCLSCPIASGLAWSPPASRTTQVLRSLPCCPLWHLWVMWQSNCTGTIFWTSEVSASQLARKKDYQ